MKIFYVVLFLITGAVLVYPQAVIKEKVEINPKPQIISQGTSFNGCNYNFYDDTPIGLKFIPATISPGDTAIMQLWIDNYQYQINDNNFNIIQKTITVNPQFGQIIKASNGDYLFIAPSSIPNNITSINVSYESYFSYCVIAGKAGKVDTLNVKNNIIGKADKVITGTTTASGCLDCGPYPTGLSHFYGSDSIMISKGKLIAYFDKDTLSPGDTVNVIIKEIDANGNEISYPDTTHFEAGIIEGCGLGNILDSQGNEGQFFSSIQAPIRYVVNDSTGVDSTSIVFKFGAPLINESMPPHILKTQQKVVANNKNNIAANKHLTKGKRVNLITGSNTCTVNEYSSALTCMESEALVGTQLVIISPKQGGNNETITSEPKMPVVNCQAQLRNYNGGKVTFNWKYITADTLLQKTVGGTQLPPRYSGIGFFGSTTGTGSNISQWQVPFNSLFTGGKTVLIVNASTSEGKTFSDTVYTNSIIGLNPTLSEVKNGLSIQEQVIVYMESKPKWKQFNESTRDNYNKYGNPIYGPPHGFGLMQLDKIPPNGRRTTEDELWNWRANRATGVNILQQKYDLATKYGRDIRNGTVYGNQPAPYSWYSYKGRKIKYSNATDLTTDEQLWKEAFHGYRGGVYWRWKPRNPGDPTSPGKWLAEPTQGHNRGNEAWSIYQNILNGNPPPAWN